MARIPTVPPEDAEGRLSEVYEEIQQARGAVANVYQVHSLLPETMLGHKELYMSLLYGRGGLSRPQREMIAVVVSAANSCGYCVQHHSDALNRYWRDRDRVERLAQDPRDTRVNLSEEDLALVDLAERVAHGFGEITDGDVDALRDIGLTDEEVLDATLVASYFCFVNRVVTVLGVEEEEETDDPAYKY